MTIAYLLLKDYNGTIMEKYTNSPKDLWKGVKDLARSAMTNIVTRHPFPEDGYHSGHFVGRVSDLEPMPTHFDEFYGEVVVDQHLGPDFYDRQGSPIWDSQDLL